MGVVTPTYPTLSHLYTCTQKGKCACVHTHSSSHSHITPLTLLYTYTSKNDWGANKSSLVLYQDYHCDMWLSNKEVLEFPTCNIYHFHNKIWNSKASNASLHYLSSHFKANISLSTRMTRDQCKAHKKACDKLPTRVRSESIDIQ